MSIVLFHCLLDAAHSSIQPLQSFLEPGQAPYICVKSEPFILWHAGQSAGNSLICLDGMMNAGLRPNLHPVANLDVADNSDLSGQDYLASKPGAPGNTHLSDQETILAHYHIVSNHDKIVYFDAALYPRPAESRPVNRRVSAYFNVIVDLHYAGLVDFYMSALFVLRIPVSVCANDGARVYNDSVGDDTSVKDGSPGVYHTLLTYADPFAQVSPGTDSRPGAYLRIIPNMRERTYRDALPKQHPLAYESVRIYYRRLCRIRQKQLDCFSQSELGIPGDQKIESQFLEFRRYDKSRCPASGQQMTISGIEEKTQLPGGCAFQRP
jgi:hypothetical protein